MKKFTLKLQRVTTETFDLEVDAENQSAAETLSEAIILAMNAGTDSDAAKQLAPVVRFHIENPPWDLEDCDVQIMDVEAA